MLLFPTPIGIYGTYGQAWPAINTQNQFHIVTSIPISKEQAQLSSFLGLCNVYRRFIGYFTGTAHPINKLLENISSDKFYLNEEQKHAFNALINRIFLPPFLFIPTAVPPYSIDCDARDYFIGCSLFQTFLNVERKKIAFW